MSSLKFLLLDRKPGLLKWAMALLIILAVGIRLYNINRPGTVPDRQYRSALIARAYYYEMSSSVPEWKEAVAVTSSNRQEKLEPQITEFIVALIYWIVNGEYVWVARAISSLFWLIGGIPLFIIARKISSTESAFCALAFYWLTPFGVLISLSFLPDSLMMMGMLFSLLFIVRYYEHPSNLRLILAAVISGLAIFIKPLIVFSILGSFIALTLSQKKSLLRIIEKPLLIFIVMSLLPSVLFYGYGIFLAEYLRWKVTVSFLPHLFLSSEFWKGWIQTGSSAVGISLLITALLGLPLLKKGMPRNLIAGLWLGYLTFCFVFNYFTYQVLYYHVQLIIIVALSIGPVIVLVIHRLAQVSTRWFERIPIVTALFLILFFNFREVGKQHVYPRIEGIEIASKIGEIVNHSNRVAYLAFVYGLPLEYHGVLAGEYWPRSQKRWPLKRAHENPLSIEERFTHLGFTPEYFVITDFREYDRHHGDLKSFLEKNCPLVAQSDDYLIYKINPPVERQYER